MIPLCRSLTFTLLVTCIASSFGGTHLQAGDEYSIADTKGEYLDIITPAGQPVLRYVYRRDTSTPEKTFDTSKVFAHVLARDGKTTLTKGPGGKYPHHRGIFIGWNKLTHGGKSHDLWHARNTAQLHQTFLVTQANRRGATVTSTIQWIGNHDEPVIEETRTYRVVRDPEAHAVIDFVSELKAVGGNVELDGDPEHAGVQFRPSQQVAENKSAEYVFHEEGVDPRKQLDLPWVAETFEVDDQAWTVQHMSHPENPDGARWSAYRDYGRFGPFTVTKVADGESRTFQYRFRITEGSAPSRDQLAENYQRYAQ